MAPKVVCFNSGTNTQQSADSLISIQDCQSADSRIFIQDCTQQIHNQCCNISLGNQKSWQQAQPADRNYNLAQIMINVFFSQPPLPFLHRWPFLSQWDGDKGDTIVINFCIVDAHSDVIFPLHDVRIHQQTSRLNKQPSSCMLKARTCTLSKDTQVGEWAALFLQTVCSLK